MPCGGDAAAMQKHEWREDEDGEMTVWRAEYHASRWKVMSRPKKEEEWTRYDPVPIGVWRKLRDVLWNKYQRNRCPHKLVTGIDKIIAKEDEQED